MPVELFVSIHAPARGTTGLDHVEPPACAFQSTPPREGRPSLERHLALLALVSIHAPARGTTQLDDATRRRLTCFNPRPRARDDLRRRGQARGLYRVSIHAPARGTTSPPTRRAQPVGAVSIHAPARGTTRSTAWMSLDGGGFNPRPRARDDLPGLDPAARGADVSIHAPARGTTRATCACSSASDVFQSTPPREGRPATASRPASQWQTFQSTPPREGRPATASRSRVEVVRVSIHAPARGTTVRPRSVGQVRGDVSIHAPARGTTRRLAAPHLAAKVFQSTPPREGRHSSLSCGAPSMAVSIHAPARGTTCDSASASCS